MKAYLTAAMCVLSVHCANAQTQTFSVDGDASIGIISNSALSVQELDDISSQSDSGIKISTGLSAKWHVSDLTKVTSTYRFEQQNYNEFDQYDLDLHQYGIDASHTVKGNEFGARYDGAKASVAGKSFLDFDQVSLYYGRFLSPKTYLRMSVKSKSKRFDTASERDADGVGADIGAYHFFNEGQTMLIISANIDKETAQDSQYDFNGYGLNTKLTHKFTALNLANKAGIAWRYQNKDYKEQNSDELVTQTLSRDEYRNVTSAFWNVDLLEHVALETTAEYGDYHSELSSNTYTQSVFSAAIKVHF
jgi:hypothetical protein